MLDEQARRILVDTGFRSVQQGLLNGKPGSLATGNEIGFYPPAVRERRSCFVTLTQNNELRGCCGSLEPERKLIEDVWHNAYAAAFLDPRFKPVQHGELDDLELSISVISKLEPFPVGSLQELLAALRPGRDGLVLKWQDTRVTFIPHVWESIPDPRDFVRQLMRKAEWPDDFWAPDMQVWRYEAESIL